MDDQELDKRFQIFREVEALVQSIFGTSVVSMFTIDSNGPRRTGSGVLVSFGGARFVATAAHVLNDCANGPISLGFPNQKLVHLAKCQVASTSAPSEFLPEDVAIIHLSTANLAKLPRDVTFVDESLMVLNSAGTPEDPAGPFLYVIYGFPASNSQARFDRKTKVFKQRMSTFVADVNRQFDYAEAGLDARFCLALNYDPNEEIYDLDRKRITPPHLRGTSGGGIFRVSKHTIKLVAILTEWRKASRTVLSNKISAHLSLACSVAEAIVPRAFRSEHAPTSRS